MIVLIGVFLSFFQEGAKSDEEQQQQEQNGPTTHAKLLADVGFGGCPVSAHFRHGTAQFR